MRILQYKRGSKSAKALATALSTKRVVRDSSTFKNKYNHTIINWGCSQLPTFPVSKWLNKPEAVAIAGNKLSCFKCLEPILSGNLPEFTESKDVAQAWADEGKTVVLRTKLKGHSGEGIFIYNKEEDLKGIPHDHQGQVAPAPLYVKYIKKTKEYRAHVINGRVVDVQEKRKRRSVENDLVDYRVRNSSNGWVYCRDSVNYGDQLVDIAVDAVDCLGLDFGAVDIIYNRHYDKYYVLEVNTACGMEGSTVTSYANHIRRLLLEKGAR